MFAQYIRQTDAINDLAKSRLVRLVSALYLQSTERGVDAAKAISTYPLLGPRIGPQSLPELSRLDVTTYHFFSPSVTA